MPPIDSYPPQETGLRSRHARSATLVRYLAYGTVVLLVALPKMGLPLGDVPLYGSLIAGQVLAAWGFLRIVQTGGRSSPRVAWLGVFLFAAATLWVGQMAYLLVNERLDNRDLARFGFNLFAMSGVAIAMVAQRTDRFGKSMLASVRPAIYFLLAYGCAQIALGPETVAVRYVTATYGGSFDEVLDKHNRLSVEGDTTEKVFGTYQNGNLFAIGLYLLLPIAMHLEPSVWVRLLVLAIAHVVILFCGSAAGYGALIIIDFIAVLGSRRLRNWLLAGVTVGVTAGAAVLMVPDLRVSGIWTKLLRARLFERDITRDPRWTKSGDWWQRIVDEPTRFFFGEAHDLNVIGINEVLPLSMMQWFGFAVTLLFYGTLLSWLVPTRFHFYKAGLYAYVVSSCISGEFWFTPTAYLVGLTLGLSQQLDQQSVDTFRQDGVDPDADDPYPVLIEDDEPSSVNDRFVGSATA